MNNTTPVYLRKPVRISVTVSHDTWFELNQLSGKQGRSLSNLCSFILENGVPQYR
jgi:hypothetical protein